MLVTGDQHSAYDRTAQLVALVDRVRAENPNLPLAILIDGDLFENGNVVARRTGGAIDFAMIAALARRGPVVVNLGNHEPEFFDLAETIRRLETAGAKVVSNIADPAAGEPFASPSVRIPLGADDLVIAGVATDSVATYRAAVRPALGLAPPFDWAQRHFAALLAGATSPVVLSHAGLAADRQMLPLVPDGTLFAGAHDHLRFVQPFGRTVYFHSGAWNDYLSLAWRSRDPEGHVTWRVEQRPIGADDPGDPELAALIRKTRAENLGPDDLAVVGHRAEALSPAEAARFVAATVRDATKADAVFLGNTTFGAGLPAGPVTHVDLDACIRFDGAICTTSVDGARLRRLLAAANQGPATPFAERRGEFCHAVGPAPADLDPGKTYRIATTDWGARNTARYFGEPALTWTEFPGVKLKAAAIAALAAQ